MLSRQVSSVGGSQLNSPVAPRGTRTAKGGYAGEDMQRTSSYSAPVMTHGGQGQDAPGPRAGPPRKAPPASGRRPPPVDEESTSYGGGGGGGGLPPRSQLGGRELGRMGSFNAMAQENLGKAVMALHSIDGILNDLRNVPDIQLTQLLDGMTGRLSDGNSKVNVAALETLGRMFEVLREKAVQGLGPLVPALAGNMGSTNEKNFSHCISSGSVKGSKIMMVGKLQVIITSLYPMKPNLVVKYAIPAAFSLLKDSRGESKQASTQLLTTLASLMGPTLNDHASTLQPAAQQRVAEAVSAAGYFR
eukprot:gene17055-23350_t